MIKNKFLLLNINKHNEPQQALDYRHGHADH